MRQLQYCVAHTLTGRYVSLLFKRNKRFLGAYFFGLFGNSFELSQQFNIVCSSSWIPQNNNASKFVGCFNSKSRMRVENWSVLKSLWFYFSIGKTAAGFSAIWVLSFAVLKGTLSLAESYQSCLNQIPGNYTFCIYRFCRTIPQRRVTQVKQFFMQFSSLPSMRVSCGKT